MKITIAAISLLLAASAAGAAPSQQSGRNTTPNAVGQGMQCPMLEGGHHPGGPGEGAEGVSCPMRGQMMGRMGQVSGRMGGMLGGGMRGMDRMRGMGRMGGMHGMQGMHGMPMRGPMRGQMQGMHGGTKGGMLPPQ